MVSFFLFQWLLPLFTPRENEKKKEQERQLLQRDIQLLKRLSKNYGQNLHPQLYGLVQDLEKALRESQPLPLENYRNAKVDPLSDSYHDPLLRKLDWLSKFRWSIIVVACSLFLYLRFRKKLEESGSPTLGSSWNRLKKGVSVPKLDSGKSEPNPSSGNFPWGLEEFRDYPLEKKLDFVPFFLSKLQSSDATERHKIKQFIENVSDFSPLLLFYNKTTSKKYKALSLLILGMVYPEKEESQSLLKAAKQSQEIALSHAAEKSLHFRRELE